jgi:hypothetical protein
VSACEPELTRFFVRRPDVSINRFARLLTQFKANGMSGFRLADGCPIDCHAVRCHVIDREADDVAASELAVDGKIEHCQVSDGTFDLELGPYRPDIIGSERGANRSVFPYSMRSEAIFRDRLSSLFAWPSPLVQ